MMRSGVPDDAPPFPGPQAPSAVVPTAAAAEAAANRPKERRLRRWLLVDIAVPCLSARTYATLRTTWSNW
ncbi:hypothetical protein GCM10015534_56140 [Streptomyces diastaticus subsp. diastaticus]|nr:hypothetical protein GCM10015534_56140 [Streptomyces diastaticus subsp. diastaticus]